MALTLYAHPFSSYCQKALIAFYENDVPFTFRHLAERGVGAELERLWPLKRFPVLVDGDRTVIEASLIIEYLDTRADVRRRMISPEIHPALEVRFLDRFFDNYIQTPMQLIVSDARREEGRHDPQGVSDARQTLDKAYAWLDARMSDREWSAGGFSLADCAAGPALFYADWAHPIGDTFRHVRAYRARLNARASFSRAIEEARPYRHLFPLGAPDRD